jgi:hypothetical protein
MLDCFNDSITFTHAWTGTKRNSVSFFAGTYSCMWFVRITPGSASVDEDFELTGNICPVGWGNRDDNVRPFVFGNYFKNIILRIILLKTFCGSMAPATTFA